ncbi:hypothetical protein FEM48_Zijuj08G0116100 [Ziziphus jujuba var. spinosa]|uniref:Red chlorophyll catabolite reductase, chloroplastic-like n=1 Tax=Ziziphus jujuba var. spinosa TaxID=714518 RepID=A0A978UYV5_ZIZJJ|nr:hypothetical protein FEM48_Zijuj08G0116100 [Ziziphus jujuba var. spinosa]
MYLASRLSRPRISASSTSSPIMEFPYVSPPHRDLMVDLLSTVETRLDSQLLPSTLPPDVQSFQNQSGTAHGSFHIRSGHDSSPIDFILGSWLHCELPTGGALNITSLSSYLNSSTDAPNFLIELIQSSSTSLILILDLPPRKDLALHPDYLRTFYEDTKLDAPRQTLEIIPEVKPYFSSSLYIRSVVSPTAITVRIEGDAGDSGRLEEIIKQHLDPIAKQVLGIWLDQCASGKREVGESERAGLENRDKLIKSKTIEIDLGSNFPRLFGREIADRVLGTIQEIFSK